MDIYESHPQWKELEGLCRDIENLKIKAHRLREKIDCDLFKKQKINEVKE